MAQSTTTEMEFQLRKLVTKYSDLFAYHQWPSEHDRWIELVFALVARISDKPEPDVRNAIEQLDDLGLLEVEELSSIPQSGGSIDYKSQAAKRVIESLSEPQFTEEGLEKPGFTEEQSKNILLIINEAAKSLMEHHDGKIQKYLRKYGQQMVDELANNFTFSSMDEKDIKYAFIYWLQNVLNMPVNLKMKSMETFCSKVGISEEELLKEADNLNINVALLDDLIEQHMQDTRKEEAS
jgi:hypothetical protein